MAKGAIIFLLDSSFLPGLKVFCYSARDAFRHSKEHIVILTEDKKVQSDPFVRGFADRVILISEEEKHRFRTINIDDVDKIYHRDDIGAYWFLKFYMFRNLGYRYHIFLDTDLLCLDPKFRFNQLPTQGDFSAAPTVGPHALELESWDHRPEGDHLDACADRIIKISKKNYRISRTINSGVVRIGERLLGDQSVADLIQLASDQSFRLEQDVVRAYVEQEKVKFKSLSVWFNFPMLPALVLGRSKFPEFSSKIKILHYNRTPKPWADDARRDWLDMMWLEQSLASKRWVAAKSGKISHLRKRLKNLIRLRPAGSR